MAAFLFPYPFPKLAATAHGLYNCGGAVQRGTFAKQRFPCGLPYLRHERTEWLGLGESQGPLAAMPRIPEAWQRPSSVYTSVSAGSIF